MINIIFKNITILDENFELQKNMNVVIKDDVITYIGDIYPIGEVGEIYDGKNKLLIPGFVNSHSHLPMSIMRGYGENMKLDDWLNKCIFPFEAKLSKDDVYYSTLLGIAEMIRFGITSTQDMYFFGEMIAKAVIDSGVKCNLSVSTTCFDDRSYYELPIYQEAKYLIENYHNTCDGRIIIDLSLHAEYTSTKRVASEIAEFAKKTNLAMHVHMSETKAEHDACKTRHNGKTPAELFYDAGIFDVRTTAAHCNYIEGNDFNILKEKGVTVATCPKSNLKLASGICNVPRLLECGINVALGTDSVASNNNLNMLEEIKTFSLIHKGNSLNPSVITPKQAMYVATRAGVIAQGRKNTGVIKVGYKADITVLDISNPYMQPIHNLLNNLIFSSCGTDVCLTMVNGKVLYINGEYKTVDIEKIIYEVEKSLQRILL